MNLPDAWRRTFADAVIEQQTIGESRADVWRISPADSAALFVKCEQVMTWGELPGEVQRLRWLETLDLPAPRVLETTTEAEHNWLLMTAVPGRDLASSEQLSPLQIVTLTAQALRELHAVAIDSCPFDHCLDKKIPLAREHVRAGLIDEEDFDDARLGRSAEDVFQQLLAERPPHEELVVTHGDACLPNLLAEHGRFSGFVDCGRLGVADRYQDLALAAHSITDNLGEQWLPAFFEAYGVQPDQRRIAFYQLLDEFF
ncbi:APH(3')-II family aminoglycoside O-phosphotransferase [Pseudomonas sp. GM80]|uniref:APH(3')-II family aminoglycoside O-phosphotransferase n=1 Tax=Pseudomonas sp. GM80 TaxID=1144339 RepID=UPI00026F8C76|nr:APH(3') family aminoglycoside O-phosphotransferase [Pseudomonas sp. GM80]EJN27605.1 aminoglycoside phosphotransferase [Pseudomonas sp. GM80]